MLDDSEHENAAPSRLGARFQTNRPRMRWKLHHVVGSFRSPALAVLIVVTALAGLFVASFSSALGDPRPRDVPIAAVGLSVARADAAFNQQMPSVVAATAYADARSASAAVDRQRVYAVIVLTAAHRGTLLLSSASGPSVAVALQGDASSAAESLDLAGGLPVRDLHPVSARDPNSTIFFYCALAAVIMGFIGAVQTAAHARDLRLGQQMAWSAARSGSVGLVIPVVVGPLLHLQPLPLLSAWLLLSWTSWTTGATYELFRLVVGPAWSMLPTWLVFIVVGNPGSGGPVADPLLPAPLADVGRLMPAGAAIAVLRDLTYFPDHLQALPIGALLVWGGASTVAWLLLERRRRDHLSTASP